VVGNLILLTLVDFFVGRSLNVYEQVISLRRRTNEFVKFQLSRNLLVTLCVLNHKQHDERDRCGGYFKVSIPVLWITLNRQCN